MLKSLYVLPPLLYLALLPHGVAAPSAQTALFAQVAPSAQAAVPATNPVTPTADSQAHAQETYKIDCAMCHGAKGDGKGDLVADLNLDLKSLRDPATLQGKTDGEVFTIIRDGRGKMPPEVDRANPDEIWNLVVLVRSFSSK